MGLPAKGLPQLIYVRLKGKARELDLAKIGMTGRVRLAVTGIKGNRVLEIQSITVDRSGPESHNSS